MTTLVVVSGLPASGKTTLARALAAALGMVHLDKDAFLEPLLAGGRVSGPAERAALSRRADADFQAQALRLPSVVLSSWWRHPRSARESGTSIGWLSAPGQNVVEVHCHCPAPEAVRRFLARERHPGHLDALRSPEGLLAQFQEAEALGPLLPDQAIVFSTASPTASEALAALVKQVRQRVRGASAA
jgi:predicted kinase